MHTRPLETVRAAHHDVPHVKRPLSCIPADFERLVPLGQAAGSAQLSCALPEQAVLNATSLRGARMRRPAIWTRFQSATVSTALRGGSAAGRGPSAGPLH